MVTSPGLLVFRQCLPRHLYWLLLLHAAFVSRPCLGRSPVDFWAPYSPCSSLLEFRCLLQRWEFYYARVRFSPILGAWHCRHLELGNYSVLFSLPLLLLLS